MQLMTLTDQMKKDNTTWKSYDTINYLYEQDSNVAIKTIQCLRGWK